MIFNDQNDLVTSWIRTSTSGQRTYTQRTPFYLTRDFVYPVRRKGYVRGAKTNPRQLDHMFTPFFLIGVSAGAAVDSSITIFSILEAPECPILSLPSWDQSHISLRAQSLPNLLKQSSGTPVHFPTIEMIGIFILQPNFPGGDGRTQKNAQRRLKSYVKGH